MQLSKKQIHILNQIQYAIASVIGVAFGIGLIPTLYDNVKQVIMVAITIQIFISFLRMRFLNVFLEIFLLGLGLLSLIPLLGYIFRFGGIFVAILEMVSFKNYILYRQMELRTLAKRPNKKTGKKPKTNFKDAEFKEK